MSKWHPKIPLKSAIGKKDIWIGNRRCLGVFFWSIELLCNFKCVCAWIIDDRREYRTKQEGDKSEVGRSGTQGNKSSERERKKCHVIEMTKKIGKRARDTAGNLRGKSESETGYGEMEGVEKEGNWKWEDTWSEGEAVLQPNGLVSLTLENSWRKGKGNVASYSECKWAGVWKTVFRRYKRYTRRL